MIMVDEQITKDVELRRPLGILGGYLASIRKETELPHLLTLWDQAILRMDFAAVALKYPLLIATLLNVNDAVRYREAESAIRIWNEEQVLSLLVYASASPDNSIRTDRDQEYLDDASFELGGMLESLDRFNEPDAYLRTSRCGGNIGDIVEPILLSKFLFDVEGYATNFATAKRHWNRLQSNNG